MRRFVHDAHRAERIGERGADGVVDTGAAHAIGTSKGNSVDREGAR
ncbi:MAG TPA: hypothetical protein VH054_17830 [Polyangiaceae bacterium]|nr:hypothetical protein [Polyangiaceae bacterium]